MTYVLRIGHDQTPADAYHFTAEILAHALESLGRGDWRLQIVPEARLGAEPAMIEKVIAGELDMVVVTAANAAPLVPELSLFSVPYLFSGGGHFARVAEHADFVRLIDAAIATRQPALLRLGTVSPGVRNLVTVHRRVETLADLRGLRMRVMASPIEASVWKKLGTVPEPLPFGEIATAMKAGRIDGAEDTTAIYHAQGLYRFAAHLALTRHQWSVGLVLANRRRVEGLPEDVRATLTDAGARATGPVLGYAERYADEALRSLRKTPGVIVTEPDPDSFVSRLRDLRHTVSREVGGDEMLDLIEGV